MKKPITLVTLTVIIFLLLGASVACKASEWQDLGTKTLERADYLQSGFGGKDVWQLTFDDGTILVVEPNRTLVYTVGTRYSIKVCVAINDSIGPYEGQVKVEEAE